MVSCAAALRGSRSCVSARSVTLSVENPRIAVGAHAHGARKRRGLPRRRGGHEIVERQLCSVEALALLPPPQPLPRAREAISLANWKALRSIAEDDYEKSRRPVRMRFRAKMPVGALEQRGFGGGGGNVHRPRGLGTASALSGPAAHHGAELSRPRRAEHRALEALGAQRVEKAAWPSPSWRPTSSRALSSTSVGALARALQRPRVEPSPGGNEEAYGDSPPMLFATVSPTSPPVASRDGAAAHAGD